MPVRCGSVAIALGFEYDDLRRVFVVYEEL